MRKLSKNVGDAALLVLAIGFIAWAYFFSTPGTWEAIKASYAGFALPGSGIGFWDWVVAAGILMGLISTLILLNRGHKILRGPVNITLIQ